MRILILYFVFSILISTLLMVKDARGQDTTVKRFSHYAGVQINKLLKEVINLNNSTVVTNDNPYLFNYTLIKNRNMFGLKAGFGFNYSKFTDEINPGSRLIKNSDLFYRIGVCRKSSLSEKFEIEYGVDIIGSNELTKSFSTSVTEFSSNIDSSTFQTIDKTDSYGAGLAVSLKYYLSKRILIGTETSYNYIQSKEKNHSQVFNYTFNNNNTTYSIEVENFSSKEDKLVFNLPVALFLIIKF